MAFNLTTILASWTDWVPDGATDLLLDTVGSEVQIRWGIPHPSDPAQTGLGFTPYVPPSLELNPGDTFTVGRLRHFNNLFDSTGTLVEQVTLELTFRFEDNDQDYVFPLTFTVLDGPADDSVSLVDGVPQLLSVGGLTLQVLGLTTTLAPTPSATLHSPDGFTNEALLLFKLTSFDPDEPTTTGEPTTTTPEPTTVPPTSVFSPARCTIDPVAPIEDLAVIEDCDVPLPPAPLFDCADIDVPLPLMIAATITNPGQVGPVGPVGPAGPAGPPGSDGSSGADGCTPVITVSYQTVYTNDCANAPPTSVQTFPYGECSYHIHYTFYVCAARSDCCWYVCCDGMWVAMAGGGAQCRNIGDSGATEDPDDLPPIIPPGDPCTIAGQAMLLCYCDDVSSSTSEEPCYETACTACGVSLPATLGLQVLDPEDLCPCVSGVGGAAVYEEITTCWVAENAGCELEVRLCCDGGNWTVTIESPNGIVSQPVGCEYDEEGGTVTFVAIFYYIAIKHLCYADAESTPPPDPGQDVATITLIFTASGDCVTTTPAP